MTAAAAAATAAVTLLIMFHSGFNKCCSSHTYHKSPEKKTLYLERLYLKFCDFINKKCIYFRYTYSVSSTAFDIDVLCNKNNNDNPLAMAFSSHLASSNAYPPMFVRRFEQAVYESDIGQDSICREKFQFVQP